MQSLVTAWNDFWFRPAPPDYLGFCRMLFFAGALVLLVPWHFAEWAQISDLFLYPTWPFIPLHPPVLPYGVLAVLQVVFWLSMVFGCIGLFTRPSAAVASTLMFYFQALEDSHGKTHHFNLVMIFVFAFMAIARSGDSWSIDRWWKKRRGAAQPIAPSGEYTWPFKMVWLYTACLLFAAGVSKMRMSGIGYVTSDHLRYILLEQRAYFPEWINTTPFVNSPFFPSDMNLWLAGHPLLCKVLMAGAIVLELTFPLALFSRRARIILAPSGFLMLMSFSALIGPPHYTHLLTSIFWFPWERIFRWARTLRAGPQLVPG